MGGAATVKIAEFTCERLRIGGSKGENKCLMCRLRGSKDALEEMKRKIAERITAVLIEEGKAKRENIHVAFHDISATNYAEAGVLVADQKRTP